MILPSTMKSALHKANTRGHVNHGWLDSWHTFSFAGYHDPSRVQFGALRVLNDDTVSPGMGFGMHAHQNTEIISIILSGELAHSDSTGQRHLLGAGDVQVMSAGRGIEHSEKNNHPDEMLKFLQIWITPNQLNIEPRYQQMNFTEENLSNRLLTIVSPIGSGDTGLQVYQDAWLHLGYLQKDISLQYNVRKPGNGVYAFLVSGDVTINEIAMNRRDGMALSEISFLNITADSNSQLLLIEVPMS